MASFSPVKPALEASSQPAAAMMQKSPDFSDIQGIFTGAQQQMRGSPERLAERLDHVERLHGGIDKVMEAQFWEKLKKMENIAGFVPKVLEEKDLDFIKFLVRIKRLDINFLLRRFSEKGDSEMVLFLLENGAQINESGDRGWTALDYASEEGHEASVKLLLDRIPDADIDALNPKGVNYLHLASRRGDVKLLDRLVAKGASIHAPRSRNWKAIHLAANCIGGLPVVKRLIELGAKGVEKGGPTNSTPVHYSANAEVAQYLHIDQGVPVDILDDNNWTPLHIAAYHNWSEVFEFLIDHGANIHATTKTNLTLMHIAAVGGQHLVVKRLLELGKKAHEKGGEHSSSPLHMASTDEVAHCLLDQEVPVDILDDRKWTPLHWAAENKRIEVARCLLARGANINKTTFDGKTPLDLAKDKDMIGLLKEHQTEIVESCFGDLRSVFKTTRPVKMKQESEGLLTASFETNPLSHQSFKPIYVEEHRKANVTSKPNSGLLT